MAETTKTVKRNWLNRPGLNGDAFISSSINISEEGRWFEARLAIADCSRRIELDFDIFITQKGWDEDTDAEIANNIAKARMIERYAREMRQALEAWRDQHG